MFAVSLLCHTSHFVLPGTGFLEVSAPTRPPGSPCGRLRTVTYFRQPNLEKYSLDRAALSALPGKSGSAGSRDTSSFHAQAGATAACACVSHRTVVAQMRNRPWPVTRRTRPRAASVSSRLLKKSSSRDGFLSAQPTAFGFIVIDTGEIHT